MSDDSRAVVKRADDVPGQEVAAGTATSTQVLLGPADGMPNFALRRFSMGAGGGMPRHTNSVEHEQYVLGGHARIAIGDDEYEVNPSDVVFIPAGVPHWYTTIGDEPFVFLCLVPNAADTITISQQ